MSKIIEVRFSDIDSDNHANHTKVVEWIAHKRVDMINDFIIMSKCTDVDHVLVNITANFLKPVKWPGTVRVDGTVTKVGNTSVTTEFSVYQNSEPVANATCVNVFFDPSNGTPVSIPHVLRTIMTAGG
jgi:acyl-CoA thioester hydrolase